MSLRQLMVAMVCAWLLPAAARNHAPELPSVAETDSCYSYEEVCMRMMHRPLHPVEGIWQLTSNGACVAIERYDSGAPRSITDEVVYRMVLIESPDRAARNGSVIGYLQPSAKANVYNARIYTSIVNGRICNPHGFMMQVEEKSTDTGMVSSLVLIQDSPRFQFNVWKLLPYLYRRVLRRNAPRAEVDGCVRVFPEPAKPRFSRYL